MTVITRRPENRLAKVVWLPGGKTIGQALDDVQANLEEIRAQSLDLLRAKLEEIQALGRKSAKEPKLADLEALYALSGEVLDIAGQFQAFLDFRRSRCTSTAF